MSRTLREVSQNTQIVAMSSFSLYKSRRVERKYAVITHSFLRCRPGEAGTVSLQSASEPMGVL